MFMFILNFNFILHIRSVITFHHIINVFVSNQCRPHDNCLKVIMSLEFHTKTKTIPRFLIHITYMIINNGCDCKPLRQVEMVRQTEVFFVMYCTRSLKIKCNRLMSYIDIQRIGSYLTSAKLCVEY